MIYTSKHEIYENEILPYIEKHKNDERSCNYGNVRRVVKPTYPELPDGVVIEDFDDILDTLVKANIKRKGYAEIDDNTRYTRNRLTTSECQYMSESMIKGLIFLDIAPRLRELYGEPKKRTYALTIEDKWVEVKNMYHDKEV